MVGLADADGELVEKYEYDPYGRRYVAAPNGTARASSSYGNPFAWTGQRYDPAVRLYHFWARSYSPALGRWLQRDPLEYVDGVGLYEYVAGGSLGAVDPLGLEEVGIYDRGDEGCGPKHNGPPIADAAAFEGAAEEQDEAIGALTLSEAADALEDLKEEGTTITAVHIYDHGAPGKQQFGNTLIDPNSPSWRNLASTISPGGCIYLHGCRVADGPKGKTYLQDLADSAGHPVIGYTGPRLYNTSWWDQLLIDTPRFLPGGIGIVRSPRPPSSAPSPPSSAPATGPSSGPSTQSVGLETEPGFPRPFRWWRGS